MVQVRGSSCPCTYPLVYANEISMLRAQKCDAKLTILLISKSWLLGQSPTSGGRLRARRTGGHVHSIQNTWSTLHGIQGSSNQGGTWRWVFLFLYGVWISYYWLKIKEIGINMPFIQIQYTSPLHTIHSACSTRTRSLCTVDINVCMHDPYSCKQLLYLERLIFNTTTLWFCDG
jgi:hypothetical protein